MLVEARRPIPGFPDYCCDVDGNVWSFKKTKGLPIPHRITPRPRAGYGRIALLKDGKSFYRDVHVLMALTFLGPKPFAKARVLHWDDNRMNNRLHNLRWGTHAQNIADARRNGTDLRSVHRKLTPEQVRECRKREKSMAGYAKQFGVSPLVITLAQKGLTYKEVL
jgi:hypothetical protein